MTPERWGRVQEVFAAALEKAPSERRTYVSEASGPDLELRKEVESLLAAHEHASSEFLQSPGAKAIESAIGPRKTISRGTRLGSFEIVEPLGAGGMGEVYRAKDTKLGREVALKVLPAVVSGDPERVKRFEKEARSASALNHPNIVTIHDTGSTDGVSWIAMELVEGVTLRQLVVSGPMHTKKLLGIATQIAEGLATAHEVGIVHRDLKPENVMITKAGLVKILDFGLAKLTGPVSGSGEHSNLPTMSGTSPGIIVGTVGYMSPEQASGKAVDYRSDLFSFGSILYEMATGKRAFLKKTAVDTLSAILNEEPAPISTVNPQTPAPLRWIAERLLSKEPEDRYVSTRDLAREIGTVQKNLSQASSGIAIAPEQPIKARSRRVGAAVVAAVALVALGVLGQRLMSAPPNRRGPNYRQLTFRRGNVQQARLSPDGKTAVYSAAWDGAPAELYTVEANSTESRQIGISRATIASVSMKRDLAIILVDKALTLARVPIEGGTPRELVEDVIAADWAPNGEDLAVLRRLPDGSRQLEYPIGKVLKKSDGFHGSVRVSPDGERVLAFDGDAITTIDRTGKETRTSSGWSAASVLCWSPKGDEIIFQGGRPGDDQSLIRAVSLSGKERVVLAYGPYLTLQDVGPDGRLLAELGGGRLDVLVGRKGENRERELGWFDGSFPIDLTPDGRTMLFGETYMDGLYLRRTDGTPALRLGNGTGFQISADGREVLAMEKGSPAELLLIPTGPGSIKRVRVDGFAPTWAQFVPGGASYLVGDSKTFGLVAAAGGKMTPLAASDWDSTRGIAVAPRGDRVAYFTRGGSLRIASVSGSGETTVPGQFPEAYEMLNQWSDDGRFLYLFTKSTQTTRSGQPARFDRVEISTGKRERWKDMMPSDPVGVMSIEQGRITPDGQTYAYGYWRMLASSLFVVDRVD